MPENVPVRLAMQHGPRGCEGHGERNLTFNVNSFQQLSLQVKVSAQAPLAFDQVVGMVNLLGLRNRTAPSIRGVTVKDSTQKQQNSVRRRMNAETN